MENGGDTPIDNGSYGVLMLLKRINRALEQHSAYLNKTLGLTGPQLVLLNAIVQSDGIGVGVLARRVSLSQATVTSIADRLEAKGLIVRGGDESDHRRVILRATPRASELLTSSPSPFQENFLDAFESAEPWEQTMILSSLQRISAMMDLPEGEIPAAASHHADAGPSSSPQPRARRQDSKAEAPGPEVGGTDEKA